MRIIRWLPVMIVLATALVLRAADASSLPPPAAMDQAALIAIDKAVLGPTLTGQPPDTLFLAQQNIESYFSGSADDRKKAANRLVISGIDANVLGKLCHVRLDWPALAGGVYFVDTTRAGRPVRYFLGVPGNYDRAKPWPVVVKLMSAAELGQPKDSAAVKAASQHWAEQQLKQHPDALAVVPIFEPKTGFGPSYVGMNDALDPLLQAADVVNIDPARVYLIGQSEAGAAAWNLALCHPLYFASFDSFAGWAQADWERVRLVGLINTLPVFWHDDTDKIVPLGQSTNLVSLLRERQIPIEFIKTHGQGHTPNQQTIDRLYDTMRKVTRLIYPASVALRSNRPDTIFNRADWLQVWQPMDGGKSAKIFFAGGPESMRVFTDPVTAVATCKDNQIDVTEGNVESLTVFLNDQMIDFSKPVKITVNHRERYNALATPSVQRMLADQILVGRGWRYYSAAIDIDLLPPPATPKK